MDQYNDIFNSESIKRTLFFKILTVTEYSTLDEYLEKEGSEKFRIWRDYSLRKNDEKIDENLFYLQNACYFPEQSKIIGFAYGKAIVDDSKQIVDRNIQCIFDDENEEHLILRIFNIINEYSKNVDKPLICGHNIMGYDLPFLIKRALKYELKVPILLKTILTAKPWESSALDTVALWKFGGNDYVSLENIVSHLGLKYSTLPYDLPTLSYLYHNEWIKEETQILGEKEIKNNVNLTIQLIRVMRNM